jgi:hypothetical protein
MPFWKGGDTISSSECGVDVGLHPWKAKKQIFSNVERSAK